MKAPRKAPAIRRGSAANGVATARPAVEFITSGSYLLDLVLGGGWANAKVANVVGDSSTGKTLLAVEACRNFMPLAKTLDDIRYVEAEMAYDEAYGEEIGMPSGIHPVDNINTVEAMFDDLGAFLSKRYGQHTPSLYVVDSLDALSDDAETQRDISKGSYGTQKAAVMSELFRRHIAPLAHANCTLLILSQIRDKIGVRFGETKTRSGGRALQFYCSQVIWLSELKKETRTVHGVTRAIGTNIRVRNRKNKVGKPYRETDLRVLFNYGVDDESSMLDWLEQLTGNAAVNVSDVRKQLSEAHHTRDREWLIAINEYLRNLVEERWFAIEAQLQPPMSKYE